MTRPRDTKIIIIGAGMGGLAAAITLARRGHDVTVLDAADAPGGKMRTVPSAAGPVDAGPTVLTLREVFDTLFADAGARLEDHVTLHPEPILARHSWPDGGRLDLFADTQASEDAIGAFAGAGAAAEFRRFEALTARLYTAFEAPMMRAPRPRLAGLARAALSTPGMGAALVPGRSLADLLARSFTDPRLAQLFGRYATYVGGHPELSPAVLALIWQAEARGVWSIAGGMHALAQAMADLATARGARIRLGCRVALIRRAGGRVSGVTLADGTELAADRVVFNGDPAALNTGLLGPDVKGCLPVAATAPRSLSAEVWAFAARPDGADLIRHNVFFAADPAAEFGPIARGRRPTEPTLYVCAQDRGPGRTGTDPERFEIIMNAPPLGAEEPPCLRRIFHHLARFGLTFTPEPDTTAATTPAGFERRFPGSRGALYGLSPHGVTAPFRRPTARTRLTGLYLAGGGAHPGAGVPMAARSGLHAAAAIEHDLASRSKFRRTATPGGTSTGSRNAGAGRSPSSGS